MHGVHVACHLISLSVMALTKAPTLCRPFLQPIKAGNIICACARQPGVSLIATELITFNLPESDCKIFYLPYQLSLRYMVICDIAYTLKFCNSFLLKRES
jgi:hypothetical protein